jgi:type IV secretory pathway VirD2 relaxase
MERGSCATCDANDVRFANHEHNAMSATSFDRLLRGSVLALPATREDSIAADRSIRMMRADRDRLEGKVKGGGAQAGAGGAKRPGLSRKLDKRTAMRTFDGRGARAPMSFDARQRAIVKVHYLSHAGGGGAALKAHTRYVARDAATRDDLSAAQVPAEEKSEAREAKARAHAAYLSREGHGERPVFYDAHGEGVDGAARAEGWAKSDKRHFRVILSAENGDRLGDLPAYSRQVMARAEAALGTKLQWIAVDHHDTANPHTHLIIRGRNAKGQDLIIPKDFIKYGFAGIARDVATEWLGRRSPADERRALDREVIRHAPTRLDRMIANQLPEDRTVRLASLEAPNGDPSTTRALMERARELERMGLAREVKRNVLAFSSDWQDRLKAMELHLDVRKALMQTRAQDAARAMTEPARQAIKGLPLSLGRD